MLVGAGAAKACEDYVRDEKHIVGRAKFAKALQLLNRINAHSPGSLDQRLNDQGTTIIQVTHSEFNASYGNRIIHLRDGWIVND